MGQPVPTTHQLTVELDVPTDIALDLASIRQLARESFYLELYRRGEIGSGRAASLLGIDRSTFLDLLSMHGISWFDDTMDVVQEARNARSSSGRLEYNPIDHSG